jgi:membrane protein implicated in regulation of membrane protease activity
MAQDGVPSDEDLIAQSKRGVAVFLWANLIAFAIAAAIFAGVWFAEPLTGAFSAAWDWLAAHTAWAAAAAVSPLFASLLVGYGYMRRAMRRRAKEEEAERRRAAIGAPTEGNA